MQKRRRRYRNPEQASNRKKFKATPPQLVEAITSMSLNGIPGRASRNIAADDLQREAIEDSTGILKVYI